MHLKHRPKTFEEVVGNDHIKQVLKQWCENRTFNPIMFEGERGCAKTTLAHIVAKEFGAPDENITDLNCVHFSGVDNMRERMDSLHKSSLFGKYKVLILDEIHRLSAVTQQVLLKPLEALPPNILIIACSTEPNSLISTLLDRFVRFRVSLLNFTESEYLLSSVLAKEGITFPKWKKALLLEESEGNPRRILTGLSKIININDEEEVKYLLDLNNIEENSDILKLLRVFNTVNSWEPVKNELKICLKTNSPNNIRVGLMNIISGSLMSNFPILKGIKLYDNLIKAEVYPEKANLIMALYKSI